MEGRFKEYNWRDIQRLLYQDCGLEGDAVLEKGDLWYVGGFDPPNCDRDTIIRIKIYDKDHRTRLREHTDDE